jgi:CheY-like chemotaxis protein
MCTVLERAKYDVLEAANAEEALILATQVATPIDLLLTDVVMPGMSGPELYDQLRRQQPELKVLFLSGYDRDLIGDRRSRTGVGFLPKPFAPETLLSKISEFLGLAEGEASNDISAAR